MEDEGERGQLERDRMEELGGAGVYSVDTWRRAILDDDSWKYDKIPEIMDGHNVFDFIDPDIEAKLAELEKEEELLMQEAKIRNDEGVIAEFQETQDVLDEMHSRVRHRRLVSKLNKSRNHAVAPRKAKKKAKEVEETLTKAGIASKEATEKVVRGRSSSVKRDLLGKRKRAEGSVGEDGDGGSVARKDRVRSMSRMKGLPNEEAAQKVEKTRRKRMRLHQKLGHKGEADHHIPDMMPKHLYSGKRGIGKRDRR